MNQNDRDKIAIRTVLKEMVEATYPDIALRAGEGLASPLMEMVHSGDVLVRDGPPRLFRLADQESSQ